LHFGPIQATAFGELLQAQREFFGVFLGHPTRAAAITLHFSLRQQLPAFPTCIHFLPLICGPKKLFLFHQKAAKSCNSSRNQALTNRGM
jgi:hypothetical protein